jgi:hypothetical protein
MDNKTSQSTSERSPGSSKLDNIFEPKMSNSFWILLREKSNQEPFYVKQIASDFMYRISLSTGKEQVIRCFFELNDHYLFCRKVAIGL